MYYVMMILQKLFLKLMLSLLMKIFANHVKNHGMAKIGAWSMEIQMNKIRVGQFTLKFAQNAKTTFKFLTLVPNVDNQWKKFCKCFEKRVTLKVCNKWFTYTAPD